MHTLFTLFATVLPVFGLMAAGFGLRRLQWLTREADQSLLRLCVNSLHVIAAEGVMTSAVLPIALTKHYGGDPRTALQVVLGASLAGLGHNPALDPMGRAAGGVVVSRAGWSLVFL